MLLAECPAGPEAFTLKKLECSKQAQSPEIGEVVCETHVILSFENLKLSSVFVDEQTGWTSPETVISPDLNMRPSDYHRFCSKQLYHKVQQNIHQITQCEILCPLQMFLNSKPLKVTQEKSA